MKHESHTRIMSVIKQAAPFGVIVGFGIALGAAVPTTMPNDVSSATATRPADNLLPATRPQVSAGSATRPVVASATTAPTTRPLAVQTPVGRTAGQFGGAAFGGDQFGGRGGGRGSRNSDVTGRGGRGARGGPVGSTVFDTTNNNPELPNVVQAPVRQLSAEYGILQTRSIFVRGRPVPPAQPRPANVRRPEDVLFFNGVTDTENDPNNLRAYIEDSTTQRTLPYKKGDPVGSGHIILVSKDSIDYQPATGPAVHLTVGLTLTGQNPWSSRVFDLTAPTQAASPAVASGPTSDVLQRLQEKRRLEQEAMGMGPSGAAQPAAPDDSAAPADASGNDVQADPGAGDGT